MSNYPEIRNDINRIDWENELRGNNTEESWEIIESVVKESVERNVPMQKVVQTFKKKWMNKRGAERGEGETQSLQEYRKLRTNQSKDDYNRAKQMAIYVTKNARTDFLRQGLQTISRRNPRNSTVTSTIRQL